MNDLDTETKVVAILAPTTSMWAVFAAEEDDEEIWTERVICGRILEQLFRKIERPRKSSSAMKCRQGVMRYKAWFSVKATSCW